MPPVTLAELCEHLRSSGIESRVEGDNGVTVIAVNTLDDAGPGELTFLTNPKYRELASHTRASALIVGPKLPVSTPATRLLCTDPYAALSLAIVKIHGYRVHPRWGISPHATVSATAVVGANANIGPGAAIGEHAVVGNNATIYPGCYLADHTVLGDDVVLFPNVVVYDRCRIGNRVTIHAGTVVGEDGLGYAPLGEKWAKIPQVGSVEIGDDVEIGALCAIDRATVGVTRIGAGTKFSNLIAIGHGSKIGQDCMFVAQVGLAGSVTVGRHATIAGQAGVVGHITIGDNALVGAKAGVTESVEPGQAVLGAPAQPINDARRQMMALKRLPEMRQRLKELEVEVRRLRELVEKDGRPCDDGLG